MRGSGVIVILLSMWAVITVTKGDQQVQEQSELDTKSLDTKRAFGNARLHGKRAPDWIIRILGTDEDDSRALLRYENEKKSLGQRALEEFTPEDGLGNLESENYKRVFGTSRTNGKREQQEQLLYDELKEMKRIFGSSRVGRSALNMALREDEGQSYQLPASL